MNEQMIDAVTQKIGDELRDSATANEKTAAARRTQADKHRAEAARLQVRAQDADAAAQQWDAAAQVKRQIAAWLAGRAELPTPGAVVPAGELGMAIGAQKLILPADASAEELASFRDLMEAVYAQAFQQLGKVNELLRLYRSSLDTAQLAPEDVPQPDPLTATPAQESGTHAVVPAARTALPAAGLVEPDADAECRCGRALIRLDGAWLHADSMEAGCSPAAGTATPQWITVRAPEGQDVHEPEAEPEPEPEKVTVQDGTRRVRAGLKRKKRETKPSPYKEHLGKRVVVRLKNGCRAHGVLDIASPERLVLSPCEDGPAEIAADQVAGVTPLPPRADAGIYRRDGDRLVNTLPAPVQEPRAYPDEPAVAPERQDPSALMVPPSNGADDATQALPPVRESGDGS